MKKEQRTEMVGKASDLLKRAITEVRTAQILVECAGYAKNAKPIGEILKDLSQRQEFIQAWFRREVSKDLR